MNPAVSIGTSGVVATGRPAVVTPTADYLLQQVAMHASALWDGFTHGRNSDALFQVWGAGGIELHDRMAELAVIDAQLCEALYQACDTGFPGVYTYEVTEALGDAIALHLLSTGQFPTDAEWQCALGELALSFFKQGKPEALPAIQTVLCRFLPEWKRKLCPN